MYALVYATVQFIIEASFCLNAGPSVAYDVAAKAKTHARPIVIPTGPFIFVNCLSIPHYL
jgi:hypothetical protein